MKYIVYTIEGYTELPVGTEVENCQIVDFVDKTCENEAEILKQYAEKFKIRQDLLRVIPWVDSDTISDIKQVMSYLWEIEQKHFEESEKPSDHIF